jgi:hypothetical protein
MSRSALASKWERYNEALGPGGVAVLGAGRELADATGPAEAVQQAGRLGEGERADVQAQDVPVQERQRRVRLLQAAEGVFFGLTDVFEEAADVAGREVAGVALAVKQDEAERPVGVAFAGSVLAEARPRDLADEVEQAGRLRGGGCGRELGGHGSLRVGNGVDRGRVYFRPDPRARKKAGPSGSA